MTKPRRPVNAPSKQSVTSYPESWSRHLPALVGPANLRVAGYETAIEITAAQLERVYFPLLALLANATEHGRRVVAGLAGIPGSGKSTFAAALARAAGRVLGPGDFAVVGMDGWHLSNAVLDQRTTRDATGRVIPLRQRKGSPESFDVEALAAALRRLRTADREVALPVYDRRRHDPVPDALTVSGRTRIVLVEGNYLLIDTPPWNEVSALLHPKLLLECDPAVACERTVARHVRGGFAPQEAAARFEANDRLNTETVLGANARADIRVQLSPEPRILQRD